MTSNVKASNENNLAEVQRSKKLSYKEYDSVELKEDISVDGKYGKNTLKKSEKGAVMMVYFDRNESTYEVDFPEKKVMAPVTESKLMAAFDTDWPCLP
jgi:hypothetical protein